jgi:hypothetical protein
MMVATGVITVSCAYAGRWVTATTTAMICVVTGVLFKISYGKFMSYLETDEKTIN